MHQFVKNGIDDDAGSFANELLPLRAIPGLSVLRITGLDFSLRRLGPVETETVCRYTGLFPHASIKAS